MKNCILFLLLSATATTSSATLKSEGKTKLSVNTQDSTAQITVDPGFHFNIQAPTFLENQKAKQPPATLTEKKLDFKWKGILSKDAKFNYYVCDDAKTVCEPHSDSPDVTTASTAAIATPSKVTRNINIPNSITIDSEGFILNNIEAAIATAQKKNRPILMDFTASWCPACIRLSHETFNTKEFKKAASQFILLKIDVDREENQSLLEKYSIRAFPSLVITNKDGMEMDRVLDFIPAEPLVQKLSNIKNSQVVDELKKKAQAGDKAAALKMAKNAYLALQTKECLDWYKLAGIQETEQKPIEYYMCLISESDSATTEEQISTYQKSIEAFPNSFYSVGWHLELLNLLAKDKSKDKAKESEFKKFASSAEKLIQTWLNNPEKIQAAYKNNELLELKDLIIPDLYYNWANLYEVQGLKDEAKQKFELAIQKAMELKPTTQNPTIIIYLVQYLKKSQRTEEALSWLQKLEKAYPNEYTYIQRQVTTLLDTKDYKRALPLAERSYSLSYGKNKLSTGFQLATIKKELNQKEEAKKILQEMQTSSVAQMKTSTRYLEKIETALKELK